ncbi:hypothetical protein [Planctomycetes bacterium TBK1r]|uniref:Phage gp6-like head-tail connector protein n=1 Tax=Stieleria magnilauensis TaxID=2527963 RepID=A0ABX5Y2P8_9BACT|nr:hypothetical protein TBK1r_75870 [Planctomycetes bacterium TBK1r]
MNSPTNHSLGVPIPEQDGDAPLVKAVERYVARIETGEQVDIDLYVKDYPDLGDELHDCLQAYALVAAVAHSVADGNVDHSSGTSTTEAIGNFRIIP